ncbi:hypothetical protein GCM10007199_20490 [Fictibacillus barbaricus]|nr:hypothetical protein GCM10007199_20490 [Fictibacillus barbaricus]
MLKGVQMFNWLVVFRAITYKFLKIGGVCPFPVNHITYIAK